MKDLSDLKNRRELKDNKGLREEKKGGITKLGMDMPMPSPQPSRKKTSLSKQRINPNPSASERNPLTQVKSAKIITEEFKDSKYSNKTSLKVKVKVNETSNIQNQKMIKCKCIYSHCLKQYCDCYAAGYFCKDCFCAGCENTEDNPYNKNLRIKTIPSQTNFQGCNCTHSQCQKKYCECFKNGSFCSPKCRCQDCMNLDPKKPIIKTPPSVKKESIKREFREYQSEKFEEEGKMEIDADADAYQLGDREEQIKKEIEEEREEVEEISNCSKEIENLDEKQKNWKEFKGNEIERININEQSKKINPESEGTNLIKKRKRR